MEKVYYKIGKVIVKELENINMPSNILFHCSKYIDTPIYHVSLYSYYQLNKILKQFGKSINEITFSKNGKPIIKDGYISISHSNSYYFVSYSNRIHGIDIQYEKDINLDSVIKKMFPDKIEYFSKLSDEEKKIYFYNLWTTRESIVKMEDGSLYLNNSDEYFELKNMRFIDENIYYQVKICSKEKLEVIVV